MYEHISDTRRRALHKKIAQVLEELYGEDWDKEPEVKTEHDKHKQIAMGHRNGITLKLTDKGA